MSEAGMTGRGRGAFRRAALLAVGALVLTVGGGLRLLGIQHGEPQWIFHPDVSKQAVVARAVYRGATDPYPFPKNDYRRRLYPYGTAVILGTGLRWAGAAGITSAPEGVFPENDRWLWSLRLRYFASAVYLLSAAAALALLFPVLGFWPSLVTGTLLAVEPLNARFSHYGMNDVPLAGLLLLAWIFSAQIAAGGRRGLIFSLAGGALLGAGFAVKYQALLAFPFPLASALILWRTRGFRAAAFALVLYGAAFLAAAAACSPPLAASPKLFMKDFLAFMQWQSSIMEEAGGGGAGAPRNFVWLLRFIAGSWLWLFVPPLLWSLHRVAKRVEPPPMQALLISGLSFVFLVPLVLVASREIMRENDLLHILPLFFVFSGLMISREKPPENYRGAIFAVLALAVSLLFGAAAVRDGFAFSREDTRLLARTWCRENLEPGSRVIRDTYVLPMLREDVEETRFRFLVEKRAIRGIADGKYDYVIASSLAHDRFLDPLSPFFSGETLGRYRGVIESLPVLARFEDRRLPFNHPTVTVYRGRRPPASNLNE